MSTGAANTVGQEGLSNVAHAIRRATALHVAVSISPEGTTVEQLLVTADRLAVWILGGSAASQAAPNDQFMGENPWDSRNP